MLSSNLITQFMNLRSAHTKGKLTARMQEYEKKKKKKDIASRSIRLRIRRPRRVLDLLRGLLSRVYVCSRRSHIRVRLVAARINGYGRRARTAGARGGCWRKKRKLRLASPRVKERSRNAESERRQCGRFKCICICIYIGPARRVTRPCDQIATARRAYRRIPRK